MDGDDAAERGRSTQPHQGSRHPSPRLLAQFNQWPFNMHAVISGKRRPSAIQCVHPILSISHAPHLTPNIGERVVLLLLLGRRGGRLSAGRPWIPAKSAQSTQSTQCAGRITPLTCAPSISAEFALRSMPLLRLGLHWRSPRIVHPTHTSPSTAPANRALSRVLLLWWRRRCETTAPSVVASRLLHLRLRLIVCCRTEEALVAPTAEPSTRGRSDVGRRGEERHDVLLVRLPRRSTRHCRWWPKVEIEEVVVLRGGGRAGRGSGSCGGGCDRSCCA